MSIIREVGRRKEIDKQQPSTLTNGEVAAKGKTEPPKEEAEPTIEQAQTLQYQSKKTLNDYLAATQDSPPKHAIRPQPHIGAPTRRHVIADEDIALSTSKYFQMRRALEDASYSWKKRATTKPEKQ